MIEFQRLLLSDPVRNDAFTEALRRVIVPGETVVADIGSGTGFLSFVAERFGARECLLYEMSDMLQLSEHIAAVNGMRRCRFFQTHSTAVKRPPKADVVVSETLGNFALEENIIETLNDARRFLKSDGTMIPAGLRQCVAPVAAPRLFDELNVWDRIGGFDFSAAKEMCMQNMYVKDITPEDLLDRGGDAREWDRIDFREKNSSIREATVDWKAERDQTLFGWALWWEADLVPGVTLSTSPLSGPTHWKQIYLPLLAPLPVKKGQKVQVKLRSDSRYEVKINVEWETRILDDGKVSKRMKQDMREGR